MDRIDEVTVRGFSARSCNRRHIRPRRSVMGGEGGTNMKYVLLVYQGTTPLPGTERRKTPAADGRDRVEDRGAAGRLRKPGAGDAAQEVV